VPCSIPSHSLLGRALLQGTTSLFATDHYNVVNTRERLSKLRDFSRKQTASPSYSASFDVVPQRQVVKIQQ